MGGLERPFGRVKLSGRLPGFLELCVDTLGYFVGREQASGQTVLVSFPDLEGLDCRL